LRGLLAARGPDKSCCPSDVARAVYGARFRQAMDLVRALAIELADRGELRVLQRARAVDPRRARGPIRYALPTESAAHRP
jgi:hypothetical protein